jgi:poly-gamma-glutamate synthase PgsB/CapB
VTPAEAALREHLEPLVVRLRGAAIAGLAARLAAHAGTGDPVGLAGLVVAAPRAVAALRGEHAAALRRQAAAEAEVHAATDAAGQRRALARVLRREVADPARRRADLRALGRDLDLDALRERFAGEREALEVAVELALQFVGRAATAALASDVIAAQPLRRAGLPGFLAAQATWIPRFTLRLAAVEALQRICDGLGAADPDGAIAAAMRARVDDPGEHPWVRAGALAVWIRVAPGEAAQACAAALAADAGPREFLLRRRVVDLLAQARAPWAVDLLAQALADPSELVRAGVARAALAVATREPARAAAMLAALADPAREASPVVRAWALDAAAELPGGEPLLVRALAGEAEPLPLRRACAAAGRTGGRASAAALLALAGRDDRPAAIHEAAAAALEAVDRRADPTRAAWTAVIARALATTPPGRTARVKLTRPGLPPAPDAAGLGRILADLTREDWGVDADVRGDRLVLRRGDRWRARLWRLLHELRTPGPNKRQAHSHVRGRVLRGALRAHSGVLHEVTSTGVPGERVHVDREGGWGRHLPLVDDVLGLPLLRPRPVAVVSSHGVCELSWRRGLLGRLAGRARATLRYAELAELRGQSLAADEPAARARYAEALRGLGVAMRMTPHPPPRGALRPATDPGEELSEGAGPEGQVEEDMSAGTGRETAPDLAGTRALPAELRALFPAEPRARALPPAAGAAAGWLLAPELLEWLRAHGPYFVSVSANSQQALAYFLAGLAAVVLVGAYLRRLALARARAAIPLVIGGWGTRGKSGTERLKAGLLHGLGYRVFAKTTGCEAMFIHAPPQAPPLEIYIFRPYGKATIWEQRTLVQLAATMHTDVFLWECMALNPAYVDILQHHWMRDDLSTITNAYPDHEDIQGPAGIDVAGVIARFTPERGKLVTSEINFLPLLREAARRRGTELTAIDDAAGELIPRDLLALMPYDEHPRNVALVARVAEQLDIDPMLAVVTMAEHVVPDLGVLKRFGPARLRGRTLEFINGCSANERTGFVSNWRRTGCDRLDLAAEPDHYVITVVNNRDDRVSRSQVFARVLVEDVAVDRHLIIGTNAQGLVGYTRAALANFLAAQAVVKPEDLTQGADGEALARRRLDALLARLRVVPRTPAALARQLEIFAGGAERRPSPATLAAAAERAAPWLAADAAASVALPEVLQAVTTALAGWATEAVAQAEPAPPAAPEVDAPATPAEAAAHFVRQVARAAIGARLHARLAACLAAGEAAIPGFHAALRAAYEALFLELLDVVEDPLSTGDQVVLRCALAVPPGVRATLMGTQNIKGTGLDFVYRWVALDAAQRDLQALASRDPGLRAAAWQRLESPGDPGLLDSGLVAARLAALTPAEAEAEARARAQARAETRHQARRAALATRARPRSRGERLAGWVEGWIDFIDGARRHRRARVVMRDLAAQRISHARAARVMRELDARAKGGWLIKKLRGRG